jgi:YjbE family integral membrane protein
MLMVTGAALRGVASNEPSWRPSRGQRGKTMEAFMGGLSPVEFWPALGQIMLINLILSGDNAVVIALACRGLAPSQRKWGIILGAGVAIVMRIAFTGVAMQLLSYPWLMLIGSLLLFWIAIKLLVEDGDEKDVVASSNIWGAVRTIAIADLIMSLDNVVAVAAAAKGNWALILIGLITSMPLIIFGATLVMWLLNKLPILVWVGAALLGFIAGELIVTDPGVLGLIRTNYPGIVQPNGAVIDMVKYGAAIGGAVFVVVMGALIRAMHKKKNKPAHA